MPKVSTWQEMAKTTLMSGTLRTEAQTKNGMAIPAGSTSVSTGAVERRSKQRDCALYQWSISMTWKILWCICTKASGLEEGASGTSIQDALWRTSQGGSSACGTWTSWTPGSRSPSSAPLACASTLRRTTTGSAEGRMMRLGRCPSGQGGSSRRGQGWAVPCLCWPSLPAPPFPYCQYQG